MGHNCIKTGERKPENDQDQERKIKGKKGKERKIDDL
jgi:hypothetical protein